MVLRVTRDPAVNVFRRELRPLRYRAALSAVLVALAIRVAYLFVAYISGAGVARHHVDSAGTLFAVAALVVKYAHSSPTAVLPEPARRLSHASLWLAYCVAAVALYWPALFTGFLSDDYGLIGRATAWDLSPVTPVPFRPISLFVWAALLHLGAGPFAFHVLNVALHATNGYLSGLIFGHWVPHRWSVMGGALVLTAPVAVEAVVWCSGVFDVFATTLVLSAVLTALHYADDAGPSRARRVALVAACFGAVLSKETAVVGPVLVWIVAWVNRSLTATLRRDLGLVAGVVGVFGLTRFLDSSEVVQPITKYVLQRAVFSGFGSLAVPFHRDVIQHYGWIAIVAVLILVILLSAFCISPGPRRDFRIGVGALLWIVVSIAPLIPILVVPPDLQGSRYLYLAGTAWATLIVVSAARAAVLKVVALALVLVLLGINTTATILHLIPWTEAARVRDAVEQAARVNDAMRSCQTIAVSGLPDSIDGAYVFRNSAAEAFARDLGITVVAEQPHCSFRWSEGIFVSR